MAETQRVIIPYCPRRQFLAYHDTPKRWRIMVVHRRGGKTVASINEQIRSALSCPLQNPRTAYISPLYKQSKDVAWTYAKIYGCAVPGAEANESELRIDFPNGGRFRLYGADNPDALRGIYLDDCVLDEYADMRPRFMPEIIRPALSDRRGKLTIIGTPKGRNEFFELYEAAKADPEWYSMLMRASETGLVAPDELESARKLMTEAQYAQEYECSFEAAIEGAYYGTLLEAANTSGRICPLPHKPGLPVFTAWDLGIGDDTAIWFAQRDGGYLNIIDHYATNGQPASHYVELLKDKKYVYGKHFLPHDADNREWVSGQTRLDTLKSLGLENLSLLPRIAVDDGINAVRLLLPVCRFDADKCKHGLESLRQYRREYDENKRTFKPTPLHDWASHDADAFRYLAMGLEPDAALPPDIPHYSKHRWRRGQATQESGWAA